MFDEILEPLKEYPAKFLFDLFVENIMFVFWLDGQLEIRLDIDNGFEGLNII